MIDPERLAAFALMTGATSLVPGVSMLFVMGQAIRSGWRAGAVALMGMQLGYIAWWVLAGLGLGTLAATFPVAFRMLAIGGALYLGWLGVQSIRRARRESAHEGPRPASLSRHAFRDGALIALGNPKSLIYIVALLPPFVDARAPVPTQLVILALVAMVIDLAIGAIYIAAGSRLAAAMTRPETRRRVDIAVGLVFVVIAMGILAVLATRS